MWTVIMTSREFNFLLYSGCDLKDMLQSRLLYAWYTLVMLVM